MFGFRSRLRTPPRGDHSYMEAWIHSGLLNQVSFAQTGESSVEALQERFALLPDDDPSATFEVYERFDGIHLNDPDPPAEELWRWMEGHLPPSRQGTPPSQPR